MSRIYIRPPKQYQSKSISVIYKSKTTYNDELGSWCMKTSDRVSISDVPVDALLQMEIWNLFKYIYQIHA